MKICKDCGSKSIKTRKNYSHGRNSVPTISRTCKSCNSINVMEEQKRFGRRK